MKSDNVWKQNSNLIKAIVGKYTAFLYKRPARRRLQTSFFVTKVTKKEGVDILGSIRRHRNPKSSCFSSRVGLKGLGADPRPPLPHDSL